MKGTLVCGKKFREPQEYFYKIQNNGNSENKHLKMFIFGVTVVLYFMW